MKKQNGIIAIIVFVLTTVIFFWDVLMGNAFFWEDIVRFVYPLQDFAASASANGDIPFWNPFAFSGMPFLGDLQVGFFYPLNRLLHSFISGGELSFSALQMIIIFHFLLAQCTFYALARRLEISHIGGIIGAIAYAFSLIMVCHSIHPMIVAHLAWFPSVVLFFAGALCGKYDKNLRFRCALAAGLIYGVSMLSGHTQMSLYEGLILFLIFAWNLFADIKDKRIEINAGNILTTCVCAALPIIIAAGIFMIQYLPTNELVKHSKRSDSSYEFVTQGSLEVSQAFTAMCPRMFGSVNGENDVKVPYFMPGQGQFNYWETSFYFGVSTLALACVGFVAFRRKRVVQLLLGLSVFGFLFSLGSNTFVFDIFYNLPFFGLFRNPGRMMFVVVFAASLLAGYGVDALITKKENQKTLYIVLGILVAVVLIGAFGLFGSLANVPEEFADDYTAQGLIASVFVILTACVAFALSKIKLPMAMNFAGAALAIIVFADLYVAGADFNKSSAEPMPQVTVSPELEKILKPHAPGNVFRVKTRLYDAAGHTIGKAMEDNAGMVSELMLVEGYNPLQLERMNPPANENSINDMRNVRYSLEIDTLHRQLAFMERKSALGNLWLVYDYKVVPTEQLARAAKRRDLSLLKDIDFANKVVLEKSPKAQYSRNASAGIRHTYKVLKYSNNEIKYSVNSAEPAIACFSEMYYPEWHAYIDGKEVEILAANYSFRAVELPAGEHTVEMRFESPAYEKGSMISRATVGICVIAVLLLTLLGRKRKAND